jgi:L-asparaginase
MAEVYHRTPIAMTLTPSLVFLSCGGTIEKIYQPNTGQLTFHESHISDWVKQFRISQTVAVEVVMLIDSLEMTDAHRETLANAVAGTQSSQIVILHGTDTMVESANRVMLQRRDDQTIVFTGAMVPASQAQSDAFFNIGLATGAVQTLPPGVYIAMSGQIFPADSVQKNKALGRFESTESENGTLRITKRKQTSGFR